MRFVAFGLISASILLAQRPVIQAGGVRNGASYTKGYSAGSIVSIFGTNLAATTELAAATPLPTKLAGTSVTFGGTAAFLLYVSPTQINLQTPIGGGPVVVTTALGSSDPYPDPTVTPDFIDSIVGLFTADSSGCGQALAINVDSSTGGTSINSSSNSLSPGDFVSLYGTGLCCYVPSLGPPDGTPTPMSPLYSPGPSPSAVDFQNPFPAGGLIWQGRAPGLVGVDQFNLKVPVSTREGCAVPVQVMSRGTSKPVTVAIHKGGGACVDPPSIGYGEITWERSSTTTVSTTTVAETVSVSLQASPGKQIPSPPSYVEKDDRFVSNYVGPSCPIPGYRSLDGGTVTVGFPAGSISAALIQLPDAQASGLSIYQASLPAEAIHSGGTYSVTASGGAGSGAIQSGIHIGSGIQITTPLAGISLGTTAPLIVNWTGGDPDSWVTLKLVGVLQGGTQFRRVQVRASDGTARMDRVNGDFGVPSPNEIIVEVTPDPSQIATFQANGLALGRHAWRYSYHFPGIALTRF